MRFVRLVVISLIALFSASLSACGFSPLYGTRGVSSTLSDIRVETGRERADFRLQEALLDGMNARHANGPYTLTGTTTVDSVPFGVGADAIASRYAVRVSVSWQLRRDGDTAPALSGQARSEASYDVPSGVYGALNAEANAERRAIDMAADRIIAQLARAMQDREAW